MPGSNAIKLLIDLNKGYAIQVLSCLRTGVHSAGSKGFTQYLFNELISNYTFVCRTLFQVNAYFNTFKHEQGYHLNSFHTARLAC